ncbi:MAG TPA: hypothetical protein VIU12_11250 [Chryseolinea sp.]
MKKHNRVILVWIASLLIILFSVSRCGKKAETATSNVDSAAIKDISPPKPQRKDIPPPKLSRRDTSSLKQLPRAHHKKRRRVTSSPKLHRPQLDSAAADYGGFPKFPWPPPRATSAVLIPSVFFSGLTTFDAVDEKICKALDKSGYVEKSYYAVPGGFALVTHLEQIKVQGDTIASPNRWTQSAPQLEFSLSNIIDQLFHAHPGYFRIIVFIVTPQPFPASSSPIALPEAEKLLVEGYDALPPQMASGQLPAGTKCKIHVYQFKKPESDPAIFLGDGVTADVHLRKAGLWNSLNR